MVEEPRTFVRVLGIQMVNRLTVYGFTGTLTIELITVCIFDSYKTIFVALG